MGKGDMMFLARSTLTPETGSALFHLKRSCHPRNVPICSARFDPDRKYTITRAFTYETQYDI